MHKNIARLIWIGAAALTSGLGAPSDAQACGGFFCSQAAPVNQAAERIIFSENGDGTVTAVIQILYQGPAEKFSWLLPISTVPTGDQIAIASNFAFQRLQAATNPQYSLTTRVEGTCRSELSAGTGGSASMALPGSASSGGSASSDGGVKVEASGVVGAFEWTVISLDKTLPDPADVAVAWLEENGYDVASGARDLIRPYLQDGLYLLALRLTKGSDSGSIRPIVLTYAADQPMIPIKLTAVAANEDMGVMTWLLSNARGVPQNYLALELNEAKINWFNAASNYNTVVTDAANEANGQGFVTEYAAASQTLANSVWSTGEEAQWQTFSSTSFSSLWQLFDISLSRWGTFDGFWDAVRATVTMPENVTFEDFQRCPSCYSFEELQFSPAAYIAALDRDVIEPVRRVQKLIDSRPYVTRLYTTMSAAEMNVDPLFTFNPELPTVSNIHTAERVIECRSDLYQSQAPWRIELPQGGVIRGVGSQAGTWPAETASLPSNIRISRLSNSGPGAVLEDNAQVISEQLAQYNASLPEPVPSPGSGGTSPAASPSPSVSARGGGCSVTVPGVGDVAWLFASAAGLLLWAQRRRSAKSIQ